jgi:hypothetical protein
MKKIWISADQFKAIITKAGMTAEEFKALLEGDADANLDQDNFDKVMGKLFSISDAKTSKEVEDHFKSKLFDKTDNAVKEYLKGAGLDDAAIAKLIDGKASPDKIKLALKHVQDLGKADGTKTDSDREKDWQTKETEFKNQIQTLTNDLNTEKSARYADATDTALDSFFGNADNFKLVPGLPKEVQLRIIKEDFLKAADAKGAKVVIKDKVPVLVHKDDEAKPFTEVGSTTAVDSKTFGLGVVEKLGLLDKQPGKVEKTDNPLPPTNQNGAPVDLAAIEAFNANHAQIMGSLTE